MLSHIKTKFGQLSKPSAVMIKYGLIISCLILIISFTIYIVNDYSANYSYSIEEISITLAYNSSAVLAESTIGGLFLDSFLKKNNKEEEK